jgi:hypothetical protein
MKEFDKLKKAVEANRFDGRIKAIKEAFADHEERLEQGSFWQKIKQWAKG